MIKTPSVKDIWIIHYSVPNKSKKDLLRPFIVINIINHQIYGIPLTSFKKERYKKEYGDIVFESNFLGTKSIIKPYQIIKIRLEHFKNKVGYIDEELINDINQKIDTNSIEYLSMKNISSIMREYVIERQNQKIENLVQEITKIKSELTIAQSKLQLIEKDKEILLQIANKIINDLQIRLENLQNQLIITK